MKTRKLGMTIGLMSSFIIAVSSVRAATTISFNLTGSQFVINGTPTTASASGGVAGPGTLNATTDTGLNDVSWSDAATGTSGVVDISFLLTSVNGFNIGRSTTSGAIGGIGTGSPANGFVRGNDGAFTVSNLALTKVSGDDFTLDGFSSLSFFRSGGTAVYIIGGLSTAITATGSYATTAPTTSFSWDADSNSSYTFTGASIQLTGVPEPSASLLGALGMLVLLRRRR